MIDDVPFGVTTWPKRNTFRYLYINRELTVTPAFGVKDRDESNKEKKMTLEEAGAKAEENFKH
jgi:hypothetical protein